MSETEGKVKIKVDVDMDQAVREFERLKKTQEQQAAATKLVGSKFEELGKSMVGLQMHDAFNKISKAAKEASGGVLDLNAAFAGYQAAGFYGAAIGAFGEAALKATAISGNLGDALDRVRDGTERGKSAIVEFKDKQFEAAAQTFKASDALAVAMKAARDYADSINVVGRALSSVSRNAPDWIGRITGQALGVDAWGNGADEVRAAMSGEAMSAKGHGVSGDFLGGLTGGITGKKTKRTGEETDKQRKARLRRMLGYRGTEGYDPFDVRSEGGYARAEETGDGLDEWVFGNAGQGKATENLDEFGRKRDELSNLNNELEKTAHWKAELAANRASSDSFMESTFGKLGEIDAYKSAFDGLTAGVTAGYDAMVDGTMSFGAAFKKSIAESLKAFGGKMLVEALAETAYGIRDLATYNYGGAALHFKSAAGFGVAAVAAGVVAHGMGTGGGGSGAGASGGGGGSAGAPYVGGSGSSSGDSGKHITIVYGDGFANDSPRNRQARVDRDIRKSLGSSGVGNN